MKAVKFLAIWFAACLLAFTAISATVRAGTVYAIGNRVNGPGGSPSGLYTIDTSSGAATLVRTLDFSGSYTGLTFLNETLYASNVRINGETATGVVNISTGGFTAIASQQGQNNWQGLAGNNAANVLYTAERSGGGGPLLSLALSGIVSPIGAGNVPATGMAYDNLHGILYYHTAENLYTVSTSTGNAALIGATGLGVFGHVALTYDHIDEILYAATSRQLVPDGPILHDFYRVDEKTGAFTLIGSNNVGDVWMDGIAWTAAPEPSGVCLALLGIVPIAGASVASRRLRKVECKSLA